MPDTKGSGGKGSSDKASGGKADSKGSHGKGNHRKGSNGKGSNGKGGNYDKYASNQKDSARSVIKALYGVGTGGKPKK